MNRRALLASAAAIPAVALGTAPASAAPAIDPVFAAYAAYKRADKAYADADERANDAGGDPCVTIPAVMGKPLRAITPADIDKAIEQERLNLMLHGARWCVEGESPEKVARIRERQEAARRYVRPDADALKADLAVRKARFAAAMEAENVAALDQAAGDAWRAFLATDATTAAGIALKIRTEDYNESGAVNAALADLDRMAGEVATGSTPAPAIDPDIETPVARLHSIITALTARVDASTGDDNCPDFIALSDRLHDAEMQMATAPAQTTRDMALKAWFMRDYLHNAGTIYDVILADVARVVGPEAVRELDAMNAARHRNDQRNAEMFAAFGPNLEGLMDLPFSERPAALRAAGITI